MVDDENNSSEEQKETEAHSLVEANASTIEKKTTDK